MFIDVYSVEAIGSMLFPGSLLNLLPFSQFREDPGDEAGFGGPVYRHVEHLRSSDLEKRLDRATHCSRFQKIEDSGAILLAPLPR